MFRLARAYMMTTAGYSGIMAAAKSWEDTSNFKPEERIKVIAEAALLAAVKGPGQVTKDILDTLTDKK